MVTSPDTLLALPTLGSREERDMKSGLVTSCHRVWVYIILDLIRKKYVKPCELSGALTTPKSQ